MTRKDLIPYCIAVIALLIGSFYDYQITDTLYHANSVFGIFFERIVLIPIQSVVMFTMCMMYVKNHHSIYIILALIANFYVVHDTLHYWMDIDSFVIAGIALASLLITFVTILILQRCDRLWIHQHLSFFLFFTMVLLTSALITTLIKMGWGRIRYRDLQDASNFCVWYRPCGLYGNHSFPSGHTTGISAVLCLLQWIHRLSQKQSVWMYVLVTSLIVMMIISRMMMGAHFLSDTAVGFMITYSTYLFYRNFWMKERI